MNGNGKGFLPSPRLLALAVISLGASACAVLRGTPAPTPWVPGSYDFESQLSTETIKGRIEVTEEGPIEVTTSLGACWAPFSSVWRPWDRSRTFACAGERRIVVSHGTKVRPPIVGSFSDTKAVTREEVVGRTCTEYGVDEAGVQFCLTWVEKVERVTRNVTERAPIWLVESAPAGTP